MTQEMFTEAPPAQDVSTIHGRDQTLHQTLVGVVIRFSLYTGGLLVAYTMLPDLVRNGDSVVFNEGGPIEWLQILLLGATAFMFMAGSLRYHSMHRWFMVCSVLCLTACIRELDSFFDALLPYGGWQLPAIVVVCIGVITIWRAPGQFIQQAQKAVSRRGFAILWAGFVVAIVFAQLVGHGAFLQELMGDDYVRDYKRVIEELGELFGYALLMIGGIESILEAPSSQRSLARQAASDMNHSNPA